MRAGPTIALLAAAAAMPLASNGSRAEPDIVRAGKTIEFVAAVIGRLKAAAQLCGYGGTERWDAIVERIDRHYVRCVAEDGRWSRLMSDPDRKECEAKPTDVLCGPGSISVRIDFEWDVRRARSIGIDAFCSSFPWKWVLEPGPDNDRAKAAFMKTDPRSEVSVMLAGFDAVEAMGRKLDGVAAPCDTSYR
jgi:hypothetical protein